MRIKKNGSKQRSEERKLSVLLLYQGKAAISLRDHVLDFLNSFYSPGLVTVHTLSHVEQDPTKTLTAGVGPH